MSKTFSQLADEAIDRMKADEAKTRERIASGVPLDLVPLDKLEDEDLEAIVRCARTGGNELAQSEAREAQNILDSRAESAHERSLSDYYGGGSPQTMDEIHQAAWAEHREAHKR